jgi:uncharacterized YccA/Bax inhibitor family protein
VLVTVLVVLWKRKSDAPKPILYYIIVGGFVTGLTCLLLGVFGAIIIYPESNIAPIIGFIYTGPIGFIVGLIAGGLYWKLKVKDKTPETE